MAAKGFFSTYWRDKRMALNKAKEDGIVLIETARTGTGQHVLVACPYNPDFVAGARELAGKWRDRTGRWSFNINSKRLVIELASRVFGKERVQVI